MPKIEVFKHRLEHYAGKTYNTDELEEILSVAKGELDDVNETEGTLKLEFNDTNRPDLWSTAGAGRQLRVYEGGNVPAYDFFSTQGSNKDAGKYKVVVDPSLKDIRPYITAFVVSGKSIDEAALKDLIQTQEKLCWNFGQKRKSVAMGVYRSDKIAYPVQYKAVDPAGRSFVPLGLEEKLDLNQILEKHPKGQEFGPIVSGSKKFPFLEDANGDILSFPPIINSARIGAVEAGDSDLFVEMTGTDLPSLTLAASIVACDLADDGFTVHPVAIEYPYDTPFGKELVTPFYFQKEMSVELPSIRKMTGTDMSIDEAKNCLAKMGVSCDAEGETITVKPPEYRNDFLHAVDIMEDIIIGRGLNSFEPELPADFTVGRLTEGEKFSRKIKNLMVGLGYQEMIYNYLGSGKNYIERMNLPGEGFVEVANPMSENYAFVRSSILPGLLESESVSANAVYPHLIFEVGKVAFLDTSENYGSATRNYLGFLASEKDAGFNMLNSQISAIFYYAGHDYRLKEKNDPRFIKGRCADVYVNDEHAGFFGEIHPAVLENWGITMPCAAGELDLDIISGKPQDG